MTSSPCRTCPDNWRDKNSDPCAACDRPMVFADKNHVLFTSGRQYLPADHPMQRFEHVPEREITDFIRPEEITGEKQCKGCGEIKKFDDFSRCGKNRNFRLNTCKACVGGKIRDGNKKFFAAMTDEEIKELRKKRVEVWKKRGPGKSPKSEISHEEKKAYWREKGAAYRARKKAAT